MAREDIEIARTVKGLIESEWGVEISSLNEFIKEGEELPSSKQVDAYNAAVDDYQNARSSRARADALDDIVVAYRQAPEQLEDKRKEIEQALAEYEAQQELDKQHSLMYEASAENDTTQALKHAHALRRIYQEYDVDSDSLDSYISTLESYPDTEVAREWDALIEQFDSAGGNERIELAEELIDFYNRNSGALERHRAEVAELARQLDVLDEVQTRMNLLEERDQYGEI